MKDKKPEKTGEVCPVCGLTVTEYSLFMGKCLRGHSLKPTKPQPNEYKSNLQNTDRRR
jgi:hypothetical protein